MECPPTASHKRRRLIAPLLFAVAIVVALATIILGGMHLLSIHAADQAEAALDDVIAEIDAAEPGGWRLADLERQRAIVPDAENASLRLMAAAKLLPEKWDSEAFDAVQGLAPPCRLSAENAGRLSAALAKVAPTVQRARDLARYPRGRFPALVRAADQFSYENPHAAQVRDIAQVLYGDVVAQADLGKAVAAWDSAVAILHAARSLGDEPALRSQALRLLLCRLALEAMERVLGHGTVPAIALAQAQQRLDEEMRLPLLQSAIGGERAMQHDFYARLASGETRLDDVVHVGNGDPTDMDEKIRRASLQANETGRRTNIAASHVYALRMLTRALECTNQPKAERAECLGVWHATLLDDKVRSRAPLLACLLTPDITRVTEAHERNTALVRCAVTALAAEQFRMKQQRWPKDLQELVTAGLLAVVPMDPFDGEPLRLRHADDGLVIYAVGRTKQYEGNGWDDLSLTRLNRDLLYFTECSEFRLWNPDRRNQPYIPEPLPDEP